MYNYVIYISSNTVGVVIVFMVIIKNFKTIVTFLIR